MLLSQLSKIYPGYPFRGRIPESSNPDAVVVQMRDFVGKPAIEWAGCQPVQLTGKRAPNYIQPNDILIASRGERFSSALAGAEVGAQGLKAVASPHLYVIRLLEQDVMPGFLCWWLNQLPVQRHFASQAEGTLQKSLRRAVLENAPVAVPSLDKQKTIVALAANIQAQEKALKQLTDNHQSLMTGLAQSLIA